ncbi:VWA domain-containing protein [Anabaena sp. FACHB-1237]|uniref:vWA domain-containing protein n=1 Tax=Anabaena sp. FACHB-1237 TaxID=2692769 RepID=UPI00168151D9|nr:VWA domain-containing protein [Anabaena sp. FACHB-1237]MBD2137521.1 VWA domain-containing protein [Anabaena sp. FACHB-1237]
MKVHTKSSFNDINVDAAQTINQRQLSLSISAIPTNSEASLPLNIALILDKSGSMEGEPLNKVIQAVEQLLDYLKPGDRLSIIAFANLPEVIIPNQIVTDTKTIKTTLRQKIKASGGTVIAEGLSLGITELLKGTKGAVSQVFLLTDGHGDQGLKLWKWQIGPNDNKRCVVLAKKAAKLNLTINTLGFGNNWNQNLLEKIADIAGGTLTYIEYPEQIISQFSRLFRRIQSVGLTNAYLLLSFIPSVRLAELKPIAQVLPDTVEIPVETEANGSLVIRLGDLMQDIEKVVLANIYIGKLPEGNQVIGHIQIRYDDPGTNQERLFSPLIPISVNVMSNYSPAVNEEVLKYVLLLAKYRQTQIAEAKLEIGDRLGAGTMLQTAADTALQIGDTKAATILQLSATQLQAGKDLTESELKKTRIASKTVLQ